MIEENHPQMNVEQLMQKIRDQVAKHQLQSHLIKDISIDNNFEISKFASISYIQSSLKNAESRAYIRTKWPDKLNRFPFIFTPKIQRIILKIINFLFKDQREVNFNIISALKESAAINSQLIEQIRFLNLQFHEQHKQLEKKYKHLDESYIQNYSYLKDELMQQKDIFTKFLQEAQFCLPNSLKQEQIQNFVQEDPHLLDTFYVDFEDRFRGSREDIFTRLKAYKSLIEEANIGTQEAPILDVGCGRGEWLELLREWGYIAQGIDINRVMLEQCQARGLQVTQADVIKYLQSLPDASLGAVTGFHIIEHLPFKDLIKLFDEALRVLNPGGLVIFETPNPENVLVGSNTFYIDPTHRNPLPSSMISFVAESRGFSKVKIMKLHPDSAMNMLSGSDLAERFNKYFYGPQDYAVIGYKP